MSGPPPFMCACGRPVDRDEAVSVWITAPLGMTCAKTHRGACEELAVQAVGGRRRPEPITKEDRARGRA